MQKTSADKWVIIFDEFRNYTLNAVKLLDMINATIFESIKKDELLVNLILTDMENFVQLMRIKRLMLALTNGGEVEEEGVPLERNSSQETEFTKKFHLVANSRATTIRTWRRSFQASIHG